MLATGNACSMNNAYADVESIAIGLSPAHHSCCPAPITATENHVQFRRSYSFSQSAHVFQAKSPNILP